MRDYHRESSAYLFEAKKYEVCARSLHAKIYHSNQYSIAQPATI